MHAKISGTDTVEVCQTWIQHLFLRWTFFPPDIFSSDQPSTAEQLFHGTDSLPSPPSPSGNRPHQSGILLNLAVLVFTPQTLLCTTLQAASPCHSRGHQPHLQQEHEGTPLGRWLLPHKTSLGVRWYIIYNSSSKPIRGWPQCL